MKLAKQEMKIINLYQVKNTVSNLKLSCLQQNLLWHATKSDHFSLCYLAKGGSAAWTLITSQLFILTSNVKKKNKAKSLHF